MEIVYFTVVAIALYFGADAILQWLERMRGARFESRQLVFLAIILPLALATFALIRGLSGSPG
jgi:predicted PurR-regulated permease PerM